MWRADLEVRGQEKRKAPRGAFLGGSKHLNVLSDFRHEDEIERAAACGVLPAGRLLLVAAAETLVGHLALSVGTVRVDLGDTGGLFGFDEISCQSLISVDVIVANVLVARASDRNLVAGCLAVAIGHALSFIVCVLARLATELLRRASLHRLHVADEADFLAVLGSGQTEGAILRQ